MTYTCSACEQEIGHSNTAYMQYWNSIGFHICKNTCQILAWVWVTHRQLLWIPFTIQLSHAAGISNIYIDAHQQNVLFTVSLKRKFRNKSSTLAFLSAVKNQSITKDIYRGSRSFKRWAMTSCDGEADRANDTLLSLLTAPATNTRNMQNSHNNDSSLQWHVCQKYCEYLQWTVLTEYEVQGIPVLNCLIPPNTL